MMKIDDNMPELGKKLTPEQKRIFLARVRKKHEEDWRNPVPSPWDGTRSEEIRKEYHLDTKDSLEVAKRHAKLWDGENLELMIRNAMEEYFYHNNTRPIINTTIKKDNSSEIILAINLYRKKLREVKNYEVSDKLRDILETFEIEIKDKKDETAKE